MAAQPRACTKAAAPAEGRAPACTRALMEEVGTRPPAPAQVWGLALRLWVCAVRARPCPTSL